MSLNEMGAHVWAYRSNMTGLINISTNVMSYLLVHDVFSCDD